ncbi:DUF1674 domain-containing protein [Novilysobacter erysipheiresistens]|nr:DUF1674 domain-containing protein [Lysobacter sp.]
MIGQTPPDPASTTAAEPSGATETGPSDRRSETASVAEEFGGRAGPDPTRFGDWEKNGRCIDF